MDLQRGLESGFGGVNWLVCLFYFVVLLMSLSRVSYCGLELIDRKDVIKLMKKRHLEGRQTSFMVLKKILSSLEINITLNACMLYGRIIPQKALLMVVYPRMHIL